MNRYEVEGPVDIDLRVSVGHIEVAASARGDVVVDVAPTNPRRSGDVSLAADTTVELEGGRLRIVVPKRIILFGPTDSVDVRVEVPDGSRPTIESAYGAVRLSGDLGPARITAKYGTVTADRVAGLVLDAPYGDVDVELVAGDLEATAGHGRTRFGRVEGDARIRASHGTVDIGLAEGAVDVATSGPLTIGHARTDVRARSAYGAVRIREVGGGSVQVESGYAEVEVGVPHGVAAWVDAAAAHGAVRNELTPDPGAAGSGRTVALRLRADFADVVIRRAAASAKAATA